MTSKPNDEAKAMNKAPERSASQPGSLRTPLKRGNSNKKETMNGPLYMQSSNNVVLVRRVKRKGESFTKQLERWFVENQIGASSRAVIQIASWGGARC